MKVIYLSDSTRPMIGQFSGPYSAVRPTKFEIFIKYSSGIFFIFFIFLICRLCYINV